MNISSGRFIKSWTILLFTLLLTTGTNICQARTDNASPKPLHIGSPAFAQGKPIPALYTCDIQNISPPFHISGVPHKSKSLALIIDDPDSPSGLWMHWLLWNIDPSTAEIAQNATPANAVTGINSFGNPAYGGPCPPNGRHHYNVRLYALDTVLSLPAGAPRQSLDTAMQGHILSTATLTGTYSRQGAQSINPFKGTHR